MRNILLILLCLPMIGFGQLTMIPDPNFEQKLIDLGYDNVLDGSVNTASIDTVTYLFVTNSNISDLTGIEDFTSLTYLSCDNNQLTSLDVSQNIALVDLNCRTNSLTSLDVSQNIALVYLNCRTNSLTSLDVSQNTSLIFLYCDNNQLTSLDVSQNTFLEGLWCTDNQLTSIDVSGATSLERLYCDNNQLTSIDVSNNLLLDYLYISNNNLTSLDITNLYSFENLFASNNQISSIDLSSQTSFVHLFIDGNNLTQLDLTSLFTSSLWSCGVAEGNFQCQDLYCIEVNDLACWNNNHLWCIDTTFQQYSSNCNNISSLPEFVLRKKIMKTTDLLGRETNNQNQPLIYFYNDGTVEKKVIIE